MGPHYTSQLPIAAQTDCPENRDKLTLSLLNDNLNREPSEIKSLVWVPFELAGSS
jgi:hypothetical protein